MQQAYQPDQETLRRYADVFIHFALHGGEGIRPGEVVQVQCPDLAKPLLLALQESILRAGGNMYLRYVPTGLDRTFFELANDAQLNFFHLPYQQARAAMIDHTISIIAEHDIHELEGIPGDRIMRKGRAMQPLRELLNRKEREGKYTWTLGLYGTPAMAREARMSLEEYWEQIILACFLDESNPIAEWRSVFAENERIRLALNALGIDKIHVEADDIDLWLILGRQRQFVGGNGCNIPSFEIFTSPDWRGTNGTISFNQPLYRYGVLVNGIRLTFKDGVVVEATADQNQDLLREMLAQPNANKVGEFSLTDRRLSRINRFMAETLFDENMGGPFGNTHIAVGMSYTDTFAGDASLLSPADFEELGFNDIACSVHTDMISTTDRVVTAWLTDGTQRVIYRNGKFIV